MCAYRIGTPLFRYFIVAIFFKLARERQCSDNMIIRGVEAVTLKQSPVALPIFPHESAVSSLESEKIVGRFSTKYMNCPMAVS